MGEIKVTFLMMAYNTEKYIEKAIKSVLRQTEKNVVLCIRNNGSTDSTGDIIKKLAEEDSRIFYIENEINGVTKEGYKPFVKEWWPIKEELLGEYISIIDSDDYIENNFVEELYSVGKEKDADIVVGGNYFINENGQAIGKRTPPGIDINGLRNNPDEFPRIYNCFRTWWGKLFKTEFFLDNYEYAWNPVRPLWWNLDTLIMINYLLKVKKLVCIDKPYYYFLQRSDSTYSTRPMDAGRLLEAYALYNKDIECINSLSIYTEKNKEFIDRIHLAYLFESLEVYKHKEVPISERITWIEEILNDDIVRAYNHRLFLELYKGIEPFVADIIGDSKGDLSIYKSFFVRLKCFKDLYEADKSNVILFGMLFGCLCDSNNRYHFGDALKYLSFENLTSGVKFSLSFHNEVWRWWYYHPKDFIKTVVEEDYNEEFRAVKEQFISAFQEQDYEKACDLLEAASALCPIDRDIMYYRIQLCIMVDELELASILIATAYNLWHEDKDFNDLYNKI